MRQARMAQTRISALKGRTRVGPLLFSINTWPPRIGPKVRVPYQKKTRCEHVTTKLVLNKSTCKTIENFFVYVCEAIHKLFKLGRGWRGRCGGADHLFRGSLKH
jgi:hypothetical protein